MRTQTVLRPEDTLRTALSFLIIHRDTVFTILQESCTGTFVLGRTFLIAEPGIANPRPPGLSGTTSVDGALAGDGDVLRLKGIDTGREIETLQTFP